jgi:hypothetical protein
MNRLYLMHMPRYDSDYKARDVNGLGYTREVSGYHDVIRRGYPEPSDPRTVLLELRSLKCSPVLWATGAFAWISVSFVARQDFIDRLCEQGVTGFETCPVEVVKVASRGRRKRSSSGEPEDRILKQPNVQEAVRNDLPALCGVIVTGCLEVRLVSDRTEEKRVQPYVPVSEPDVDLCRPFLDGERYGGHLFCSRKLLGTVDPERDNVAFMPFEEWAAQMWPKIDG